MGIQQKLHTKLVQKLILTPSLQQAIKLLPMSTLELSDLLNQEMVENPMLEEVPTEELQPAEAAGRRKRPTPRRQVNKTDTWDDQDYEYFFGDYLDDGYRPRAPQEVKELPPIENTLSTASSLSDHLMWQLSMQTDDPLMREIGSAIIGNLDDDGYLVASFEELAAMGPWPLPDVERALRLIQSFDPVGVAARDLQECLLLQLRHLGLEGTPTEKVVTEHLRLLQNHQVPEIARKLGLTIDDLKEHIEVIRHLDPKPGSRYNPTPVAVRHPGRVRRQGRGSVRRGAERRTGCRRCASARSTGGCWTRAPDNNDETRAYVKDKFRSALWLIKSVEQRQKTIHKVANSIINFQRDFLDHGIEHLRPLVLRDVANDIGMHESTVSRVVTNKYMHTPQGVFEMKYFFHSGISSSYGESVSSVTIKQRIRKIIENEDPRKPLSDSKIVSILQREGLVLARRTIAKYREELKISTSNQRKVSVLMRLELTGRHLDITPALRRLVDAKLGKLERVLNDSAVSAQVVLAREKHRHLTEITLPCARRAVPARRRRCRQLGDVADTTRPTSSPTRRRSSKASGRSASGAAPGKARRWARRQRPVAARRVAAGAGARARRGCRGPFAPRGRPSR